MPDGVTRNRLLSIFALLMLFFLPLGTGPTSIFSLLFLAFWGGSASWLKGRVWWREQLPRLLPVIMLMILPAIGLIWSIVPNPNYYLLLHKSHFWLLTCATACLSYREIKLRNLILAFIVGVELYVVMVLMTVIGLIEPIGIYNSLTETGFVTYSTLLVLATVLLSFMFKMDKTALTRAIIIIFIVCNVLVLTQLRGRNGYLAFMLFAPVVVANISGWRRWWIIFASSIVIIGCLSFSPQIQNRVSTGVKEATRYFHVDKTDINYSSIGIRFLYWEGGYRIFRAHPLFGVGTGGYPVAMRELYPHIDIALWNPHNFYIYVATNFGMVGLALYGWFWISTFWRAWPYRDQWCGFTVLSGLIVISIASLTDTTPLAPATGVLLAILAGLPMETNEDVTSYAVPPD